MSSFVQLSSHLVNGRAAIETREIEWESITKKYNLEYKMKKTSDTQRDKRSGK